MTGCRAVTRLGIRQSSSWHAAMTLTAVMCLVGGCAHQAQQDEISRHPSPDDTAEAVVIRSGGTKSICEVYLTLPGASIGQGSQVFKAAMVEGLSVNWLSAKRLEIRFHAADIKYFDPVWNRSGQTIRIWMVEEHEQDAAASKDTRTPVTSCS